MVSNGSSNTQIHEIFKNCVAASYNLALAINDQSTKAFSEIEKSEDQKAVSFSEFLKLQQPKKLQDNPK